MGDDVDKSFFMSLILQFLYEYRTAQSECGQMIERGRQIEVFVNAPTVQASSIFMTPYGKEAISRAFAIQGIPPTANYMTGAKWDVQPLR